MLKNLMKLAVVMAMMFGLCLSTAIASEIEVNFDTEYEMYLCPEGTKHVTIVNESDRLSTVTVAPMQEVYQEKKIDAKQAVTIDTKAPEGDIVFVIPDKDDTKLKVTCDTLDLETT